MHTPRGRRYGPRQGGRQGGEGEGGGGCVLNSGHIDCVPRVQYHFSVLIDTVGSHPYNTTKKEAERGVSFKRDVSFPATCACTNVRNGTMGGTAISFLSSGHHWYLQDTAVSPGHAGVSSGYGIPRTPLVSSGYRGISRTPRYPQHTAGILRTRCPQDTAVSWGHRILSEDTPACPGTRYPQDTAPVLGISRYPQDAPRVPRRQLAFFQMSVVKLRGSGGNPTILSYLSAGTDVEITDETDSVRFILSYRTHPPGREAFSHAHVPLGTGYTGRGAPPPQHTPLLPSFHSMPRGQCRAKRQSRVSTGQQAAQGHSPRSQRSRAAVVVGGHEGHLGDGERLLLATDLG
jgi:hypothetical protein